jgi:hypothetical protein
LSRGGRLFVPAEPQAAVHTDASKFGYGGTLGFTIAAGTDGVVRGSGVSDAEDRREPINLLELRVLRMISAPTFGKWLKSNGIITLSGFVDKSCVVHVVNAMVSDSPAMMKELRQLKRELDELGITISLTWLPSALNYYADLLSQSWDPGDLQCTRTVLRGLLDGDAVSDATPVFRYRPLNEHPTYLHRSQPEDLNRPWTDGLARLNNPPAYLERPYCSRCDKNGQRVSSYLRTGRRRLGTAYFLACRRPSQWRSRRRPTTCDLYGSVGGI